MPPIQSFINFKDSLNYMAGRNLPPRVHLILSSKLLMLGRGEWSSALWDHRATHFTLIYGGYMEVAVCPGKASLLPNQKPTRSTLNKEEGNVQIKWPCSFSQHLRTKYVWTHWKQEEQKSPPEVMNTLFHSGTSGLAAYLHVYLAHGPTRLPPGLPGMSS